MKTMQLLLVVCLLSASQFLNAQWSELGGFNSSAFNNSILTTIKDDIGNVYVAGSFTNSNGKYYVARFDGNTWSELGGLNGLSANGIIYSICRDHLGNIYAAGNFTNSGGKYYVAKYDGISWSELAGANSLSANDIIYAVCSDPSNNIYAAGNFRNTSSTRYVAKFNGVSWSALGGLSLYPANNFIKCLCSDPSGNIYAAGAFGYGNGAHYISKFSGGSWTELGKATNGGNNTIQSICSDPSGNIYAAGDFTNASGKYYVAKVGGNGGTSWYELGAASPLSANSSIKSICSDLLGNIYAAGNFTNANGNNYVARFDGTNWGELGGGQMAANGIIFSICSDISVSSSANIYAGGNLMNTNGKFYVANYLAVQINAFNPVVASSGSTVVINGSGFSGITSILVGGVEVKKYTIVSDNEIHAIINESKTGSLNLRSGDGMVTQFGFVSYKDPNGIVDFDVSDTGYFYHPSSPRSIKLIKTIHKVNSNTYEADFGDLPNSLGYRFQVSVDINNKLFNLLFVGESSDLLVTGSSGLMTADNPGGFPYTKAPSAPGVVPFIQSAYDNSFNPNTNVFKLHYGYQVNTTNQAQYKRQIYEQWNLAPIIGSFSPKAGNCNTASNITILGGNFTNNIKTVKVGDISATSFLVVNDSTLTAVIPASASGYIIITAQSGITIQSNSVFSAGTVAKTYAYIPNYNSSSVSVLNLVTNSVEKTIPVGTTPIGVSINSDGTKVIVTNQNSNNVSIINTSKNVVEGSIAVNAQPVGIVFSQAGYTAYVACNGSGTVDYIDILNKTLIESISVGNGPAGIAITPDGLRVFVTNSNASSVSVISTINNTVITTIPVAAVPQEITISADGKKVYITHWSNNNLVTVIDAKSLSVIKTIAVGCNPYGLAINSLGTKLYVTNSGCDSVSVINTTSNAVIAKVKVGTTPEGISISPDGSKLYVANWGSSDVSVISTVNNQLLTTILTGGSNTVSIGNFITNIIVTPCLPKLNALGGGYCNGDYITIDGTGFFNITGIKVNERPVKPENILYTNSSQIFVMVDTATETGKVTVTTSGGTVQSVDSVFICPMISSITPLVSCSQGTVTVKGHNFTNANSVDINGTAVAGYSVIDKNTIQFPFDYSFGGQLTISTPFGTTTSIDSFRHGAGKIAYAFIPDYSLGQLSVINLANDKNLATIKTGNTTIKSQCITPNGKSVFILTSSNVIMVYDIATNSFISTISFPAGNFPKSMVIDKSGTKLYVANYVIVSGSAVNGNISVIDVASLSIVNTITVGKGPAFLCLSNDDTKLYLTDNANTNLAINIISTITLKIIKNLSLTGAASLNNMKVNPNGSGILLAADNISFFSIDASDNLSTVTCSLNASYFEFTPDGSKIYSFSNGKLAIFDAVTFSAINTATNPITAVSGFGMTPDGNKLLVTRSSYLRPNIMIFDAPSLVQLDTLTVGGNWPKSDKFMQIIGNIIAPCSPIITSLSSTNACKNQTVSIFGQNFSSATGVKFGSVDATNFSIITDNEIQATIGKGKTGVVSVSNITDQVNSADILRIGGVPDFSIMPSSILLCGGSPRIINTNAEDTTLVYTCSNGQIGRTVSVNAAGAYTIFAMDTVGCVSNTNNFTVSNLSNCGGFVELQSTPYIKYFGDTITVSINVKNGSNLFSGSAYLNYNNSYLSFYDYKAGDYFGNNVITTTPVDLNSKINFGISRKNGQPGSNGNGLLFQFRFLLNTLPSANFDSLFPDKTKFIFSLSSLTVYNTLGVQPASVGTASLISDTTICNYYVPVWPGDLNNDKKVNVADLLPIGYFYGSTGPVRPNASLVWKAQPAPVWGTDKTTNSSNAYKTFADGNADGIIDLGDQAAIGFNLSNTHAKMNGIGNSTQRVLTNASKSFPTNLPAVNVNIPDTVLQPAALPFTEQVSITMGSLSYPLNNLYGVAFEIYFDPAYVNIANISTNYINSIFGTQGVDFTQIEDYSEISTGKLSIALTRYNTTVITAIGGQVVNINFPLISGSPGGWFKITAIPIACNDKLGNNLTVTGSIDSLRVNNTANISISGRFITPLLKSIKTVTCNLKGISSTLSDAAGIYQFNTGISANSNVVIKASKNNDIVKNNGVSSIDIILTQNHILNKTLFNSPYKIIAADVNNDKKVTAIDVIFMKRLILGIDTTFTGNRLWAFVDSSYTFLVPSNPFPYRDSISYTGLSVSKTNQTFIGIKLGDVDFSWNPAVAKSAKMNNGPVELYYDMIDSKQTDFSPPQADRNDDMVRIPIKVKNFKDLLGMQYTLNFNSDVYQYVGIENNLLKMDFNDKRLATNDGRISFLWTDANSNALTLEDGTVLFELLLKSKSGIRSPKLEISSDITIVEAIDKDFNKHDIILTNGGLAGQHPKTKKLFTIYPNPAKDYITVQGIGMKQINIINSLGEIIMNKETAQLNPSSPNKNNKEILSVQQLWKGLYLVQVIFSDNSMNTEKLLVE